MPIDSTTNMRPRPQNSGALVAGNRQCRSQHAPKHLQIHVAFYHLCCIDPTAFVSGTSDSAVRSLFQAASSWVRPTWDRAAASNTPRKPAVHATNAVAEAAAAVSPFAGGFQLSLRHRTMFLILPASFCTVRDTPLQTLVLFPTPVFEEATE